MNFPKPKNPSLDTHLQEVKVVLLSLLLLFSCAKEETAPVVPKTGVELVALGPLNFGGVLVGESRDAAVRVINHGPDAVSLDLASSLRNPFSVISVSSPCQTGILPADKSCVMSVRFQPTVSGEWSQSINVAGGTISTSGKGLIGGLLTINEDSWDLGTFVAGREFSKTYTFKNEGDFSISAPNVELIDGTRVGLRTCGAFIQPGNECTIEIIAQKIIAGTTDEFISFNSGDGGNLKLQVLAHVLPADPASIIELDHPPAQMVANGSDTRLITTLQIKDRYNNVVADGTNVSVNTNNIINLGAAVLPTMNGIVSFQVQSTTVRGDSTISLISGEASGFLRLRSVAGPPHGTIEVETYIQELVATGGTQLVLKTKTLRDSHHNIVENGTPIYFFLVGDGTLNVATATTLLGKAQVILTSPTTTGSAIVQIRGGLTSGAGGIASYSANGDFPVTYIPGPPTGNIPIVADIGGVYAEENPVLATGSPIQSNITLGPVLDAQGNIVRENTDVSILMTNGQNLSVAGSANPANFSTNASGMITFTVAGVGTRGKIKIEATSGSATGEHSIWAFYDSNIFYDPVSENMKGYLKYYSDSANPSPTGNWGKIQTLTEVTTQDSATLNYVKTSKSTPTLFASGLPNFAWECFFSKREYVYTFPCERMPDLTESHTSVYYRDVLPQKFNGTISNGSATAIDLGLSRPTVSGAYNVSHNTYLGHPGMGYNPKLDKGIIYGGGSWEDYTSSSLIYKQYRSSSIPSTSSLQTVLSDFSTPYDINIVNILSSDGTSGDHPPELASMVMTPVDDRIYSFGGVNLLGTGTSSNALHYFNFNTDRWTALAPLADPDITQSRNPNLTDDTGMPTGRYQHGMSYIPELKSLFILGGTEKNEQTQAWVRTNDIWKLDFSILDDPAKSETDLVWGRICDGDNVQHFCKACTSGNTDPEDLTCGYVNAGVCTNHAGDDIGFSTDPDYNPSCIMPSVHKHPLNSTGIARNTNMFWHHVYQKAFVFYSNDTNVLEFDPYSESLSSSTNPINSMGGNFQVFYNQFLGRTFAFERVQNGNSRLWFYDMAVNEKSYIKIDVELGEGSKDFVQKIEPNIVFWGETDTTPGAEIYAYNYDSNIWVLWQETSANDSASASIIKDIPIANPTEFVSSEGKLTFLITPKGTANSSNSIHIDYFYIKGRF